MNEFVAPTYFIMFISLRLENTLALVVLDMMTRLTITSAMMTAKPTIVSTLLMLIRKSASSVGDCVESTFANVSICVVVSPILLISFTVTLNVSGRGLSSA